MLLDTMNKIFPNEVVRITNTIIRTIRIIHISPY